MQLCDSTRRRYLFVKSKAPEVNVTPNFVRTDGENHSPTLSVSGLLVHPCDVYRITI